MKIPFLKPYHAADSLKFVADVLDKGLTSGDHFYTRKCHQWLEANLNISKGLLTTSCTHALEMAAILSGIQPGDEVIMPSYTFVSTANAFVLRGAKIIFVDIRPDTMNIDENLIESAISERTRAIVPVHYAGVACEMEKILSISKKYNLILVEDAAQALLSTYNGEMLGGFGDFGCFSFHESKNVQCGEGGALIINNSSFLKRAEIVREKGTNRSEFFRGGAEKYEWLDLGSSFLPSDINAAVLWAQLNASNQIISDRRSVWKRYYEGFRDLNLSGDLEVPKIPSNCEHNGHIFFIKLSDEVVRGHLIHHLSSLGIKAYFHYLPLHSSPAGRKFGKFHGEDRFTTIESNRLLRLPIYSDMNLDEQNYVIQGVYQFFGKGNHIL